MAKRIEETERVVNQERKRAIEECKRTYKTDQIMKVPFRGETKQLPVIHIPTVELRFNVQLGRLILDRLTTIEVAGGADPEDPDVQRELEEKVLGLSKIEVLIGELRRNGQLEPGIITEDGYVVNGNRRLASLRKLERDTGDSKFHFMDVGVLPQATPEDLFLLEANLQMSPETRARYGPVTTAIQVRRGLVEYNLAKAMVAEAMRLSEEELQENLDILALVDGYLAFVGQPQKYSLVENTGSDPSARQGKWNVFVEINNLQKQYKNDPRWESFLRHLYVMVMNDSSMDDIRGLKKLKNLGGINIFAQEVDKAVIAAGEAVGATEAQQTKDPVVGKLLETLGRIQGSDAPTDERLLKLRAPDPQKLDQWKAITDTAYNETLDTVGNLQEKEMPIKLLSQALKKLESVDFGGARAASRRGTQKHKFKLSEARSLLAAIDKRKNGLLEDLSRLGDD